MERVNVIYAGCPLAVGDMVCDNGVEKEITEIIVMNWLKSKKLVFMFEFDNDGEFTRIKGIGDE